MYFELVKQALSASLEVIATSRRLTREQALKKVSDHLAVMSEQWYAGEAPQIAYDDPLCRWAYVYAQVPVLANLLESARSSDECAIRYGLPSLIVLIASF